MTDNTNDTMPAADAPAEKSGTKVFAEEFVNALVEKLDDTMLEATTRFNNYSSEHWAFKAAVRESLLAAIGTPAADAALREAVSNLAINQPDVLLSAAFRSMGSDSATFKAIDKLCAEAVLNNDHFADWLKSHVADNLQTYAIGAMATLFLRGMTDLARGGAFTAATEVNMAISNAFSNARVRPGGH